MKKLAAMLLLGSAGWSHATVHWDYEGAAGPAAWGRLSPEYAPCASGQYQSPINIEGAFRAEHKPLVMHYPQGGKEILHNGHTVQINFAAGNLLRLEDGAYELKQAHFHAPSENRINGKAYPLEAHFVHADAQGHLAVVAVMFEEGGFNPSLQKLWTPMPSHAGELLPVTASVRPGDLLPKNRDYYRYAGSLTTPPCSEGVRWIVLKQPLPASRQQIAQFARVIHHANNRPLQPANGRVIIR